MVSASLLVKPCHGKTRSILGMWTLHKSAFLLLDGFSILVTSLPTLTQCFIVIFGSLNRLLFCMLGFRIETQSSTDLNLLKRLPTFEPWVENITGHEIHQTEMSSGLWYYTSIISSKWLNKAFLIYSWAASSSLSALKCYFRVICLANCSLGCSSAS